jgi:hypothetical protein
MRVYGTLVVEQKTTAPKKVDAAGEILADGSLTLQNGSAKVRANSTRGSAPAFSLATTILAVECTPCA